MPPTQLAWPWILDVVYNHLGPEGNFSFDVRSLFHRQAPYSLGPSTEFRGEGSPEVRSYFVENALYWCREYHIDGLRLDAVQQIKDDAPLHIVPVITHAVKEFGRNKGREIVVVAETDENKAIYLQNIKSGGWGLDAVWSDDFHHSLYSLLTGESRSYYADFGQLEHLERALRDGFVYQGEYFSFWGKPRGTKPEGVKLPSHAICIDNHDQVGNRALGERLTELTDEHNRRLAAALICFIPSYPNDLHGAGTRSA